MKRMEESDRYNYPDLKPDSIVIDGGGYEGNWAKLLWRKHRCRIFVFEPIHEFANKIVANLEIQMTGGITVINRGLGAYQRWEGFSIQGDSSGAFGRYGPIETVEVIAIGPIIESWPEIALLKLNVEGMEYEILEALIAQDLMPRIANLQVQFHRLPGSDELISELAEGLKQTHELVYHEPYCWEGWKRK